MSLVPSARLYPTMDLDAKPAPIVIPFAGNYWPRWIVTITKAMCAEPEVYRFADPQFIGRTFGPHETIEFTFSFGPVVPLP